MPDVGMAEFQMSRQRRVIMACEKWWPLTGQNQLPNKADCSSFVNMVAKELGVNLHGDANFIHGLVQSSPWSILGRGDDAATVAAVAATNGMFVVGAWENPNPGKHGHVAVIVDTNYSSPSPGLRKRAVAYWGQIGPEEHQAEGLGKKYTLHSESWGSGKRPLVIYACCSISAN
jgi:hypothetical protein